MSGWSVEKGLDCRGEGAAKPRSEPLEVELAIGEGGRAAFGVRSGSDVFEVRLGAHGSEGHGRIGGKEGEWGGRDGRSMRRGYWGGREGREEGRMGTIPGLGRLSEAASAVIERWWEELREERGRSEGESEGVERGVSGGGRCLGVL